MRNILEEVTFFGTINKVQQSIERLRAFPPPDGKFILAFSGGKDSQVIYHLAQEAGIPFEAHYNVTGVDPPELIRFIREHYPGVIFNRPGITMWKLIPKKMIPPTRLIRYCCANLKERKFDGRMVITGVRWQESVRRKKSRAMLELNAYSRNTRKIMIYNDNDEARRILENCRMRNQHILNPIVDWSTEQVWEFLRSRNIPYCSLYDEGFKRTGCVACPNAGKKGMLRELARWPKYRALYLRAFEKMLIERKKHGLPCKLWPNAESVMHWWIYGMDRIPIAETEAGLFDE